MDADEKLFGDFVSKGRYLPKERAERCQLEYARAANAFAVLFGPYIDLKVAAKQPKRWLAPPSPLPKPGWRRPDRLGTDRIGRGLFLIDRRRP